MLSKNILSTIVRRSILVSIFLVFSMGLGGSGAIAGTESSDNCYSKVERLGFIWGEWRTKKGSTPDISLTIQRGGYQITINGKPMVMEEYAVSPYPPFWFLEFSHETYDDNFEYLTSLGLTVGEINSHTVLSGFYFERATDGEGVVAKEKYFPVTLYRMPSK